MDVRDPSTLPGAEGKIVTVFLTSESDHADRVRAVASTRYQSESEQTVVRVDPGDPTEALHRARLEFGGAPLGVVVSDEVAALDALNHGADDVLVWPPRDDEAMAGFLDRTRLRASLRRGQERASQALAHSDKLAALGTLVAGVAHEVNNPLTALQLSVEAFASSMRPHTTVVSEIAKMAEQGRGASPEEIERLHQLARNGAPAREGDDLLAEMLSATSAIADVVKDLTVFARSDSDKEETQLVDANDLADHALRLVGREIEVAGHIERDYSSELPPLVGPKGRLMQVLVNVLVNAAHALREVKRPVHRVRLSTRADDEYVAISVSDTGPGIPSDVVEHIFDPFFTTKRVGQGTGLGLSISRSILRDVGGDLIVDSVHGTGATFIALIPIPDQASVRDAYGRTSSRSSNPAVSSRRSVLLVDDDERILRAYARILGRSCNVMMANDGQEAIDLLRSGSSADALVTELSLPEVDGQELYEWLAREKPELAHRTVFVAADASRERYSEFLGLLENRVLTKPVNAQLLLSTLQEVAPDEATT